MLVGWLTTPSGTSCLSYSQVRQCTSWTCFSFLFLFCLFLLLFSYKLAVRPSSIRRISSGASVVAIACLIELQKTGGFIFVSSSFSCRIIGRLKRRQKGKRKTAGEIKRSSFSFLFVWQTFTILITPTTKKTKNKIVSVFFIFVSLGVFFFSTLSRTSQSLTRSSPDCQTL